MTATVSLTAIGLVGLIAVLLWACGYVFGYLRGYRKALRDAERVQRAVFTKMDELARQSKDES